MSVSVGQEGNKIILHTFLLKFEILAKCESTKKDQGTDPTMCFILLSSIPTTRPLALYIQKRSVATRQIKLVACTVVSESITEHWSMKNLGAKCVGDGTYMRVLRDQCRLLCTGHKSVYLCKGKERDDILVQDDTKED